MFTEKRGGGVEARQRQRQRQEKKSALLPLQYLGSAEQSINPASVCFMRHYVRAALPEGTNSSTG